MNDIRPGIRTITMVAENEHAALVRCELVRTVLQDVTAEAVHVLPACTVDDVLDILAKRRIDVLMTDERLSDISSRGLVQWLDKLLVGATKILLTSDARVLAEPWKFAGPEFSEVLQKPLQRSALRSALQRWMWRAETAVTAAGGHCRLIQKD